MGDIERALSEIVDIRNQLAAGTLFRGFGPAVVAGSGVLALAAGGVQMIWPDFLVANQVNYVICWIAVAVLAACLIGFEMIARSKRFHGGLADAMIMTAIEQFLPAAAAGAAITAAILKYAPDSIWLLPGLWQVLIATGIFASLRTLPRTVGIAAGWYFISGITVFILAASSRELTPWMMMIPFAFGQFLSAAILRAAKGSDGDEAN